MSRLIEHFSNLLIVYRVSVNIQFSGLSKYAISKRSHSWKQTFFEVPNTGLNSGQGRNQNVLLIEKSGQLFLPIAILLWEIHTLSEGKMDQCERYICIHTHIYSVFQEYEETCLFI